MSACSAGYFLVEKTCYECHHSCAECSGNADSQCLSCNSGFIFENGYCVDECGKNTVVSNGQCASTPDNGSCTSPCATCSKNLSWCLSCNQSSGTPIVNPVDGTCNGSSNGSCDPGYYVDTASSSCKKCSTRCKECELSSTS